jgi:hypothetical protein
MNLDQTIPPLRDLPSGRLGARKEHLLAEVQSSQKRPGAPWMRGWVHPRRRVAAIALALGLLTIGTGVAATTTDWLTGSPAPESVVSDFGSYAPQLGFSPEPNRAVLVAEDSDIILYATTNKEGSYCLLASAPWKRPSELGEGGICIPPALGAAPLVAGLVGARSSPDGAQTYLIAGRTTDPDARSIRFDDPTGAPIRRAIGSSGFFIAAVRTHESACVNGDWKPTFSMLGADGTERGKATITLGSAPSASPGVCVFAPPHR